MTRFIPARLRWSLLSQRGRIPLLLGGAALGLMLLGAAWIVITGLIAHSRLENVKSEIHSLRKAIEVGDTVRAHALQDDIREQARSAHSLTTGPAWWVAANIPGLGSPLRTGRAIAAQADRLGADVLPGVLRLADDLLDTPPPKNATIDLKPMADAQPLLDVAVRTAHSATRAIETTPPSWLSYVSSARNSVAKQLHDLDRDLTGASRALHVVLPMLGAQTKQRYFIGFLNEAEARGVGGIPGAFAIATADHGRITFERFGSDESLRGVRGDVDLGPQFAARYRQDDPTGVFQNSDISPDFRDAARIWAAMWEKKSGEHIDGALAIDPTALSYLLKVTGGTTLPDGSAVSPDNVVSLTQQKQYALFRTNTKTNKTNRKQYLISVAKAVASRLTRGGDPRRLVKAMSHAARERRLVVWSENPAIESKIEVADWAGAISPDRDRAFSSFVVTNSAGSKLDYYLNRAMTYRRTTCARRSTAIATLALTNNAPAKGLPEYVTIRADKPKRAKPGDSGLLVTYYARADARIVSVRVDGKPVILATQREHGAIVASIEIELPAGATKRLTFTVSEPATTKSVRVIRQPGVRPYDVSVAEPDC